MNNGILESANQWAQVARQAAENAIKAIEQNAPGRAIEYRKIADEAFEKELRLRKLLDDSAGIHKSGE